MRWRLTSLVALGALLASVAGCADEASPARSVAQTRATTPQAAQDVMALPDFAKLKPGRYSIDPDDNPSTPLRVNFDVAAQGWSQWIGTSKYLEDGFTMVTITTVTNVVSDPCRDHRAASPAVGPSVEDLARALSDLAPFEVASPARDVTLLGFRGKHLVLRVPRLPVVGAGRNRTFANCSRGQLHSWIASHNDGSYYGYNAEPGRKEEFWILDVHGTRLVIATNYADTSPPQDMVEMRAIIDSIRIAA